MTEAEALLEIAKAIEHLALVFGGIGTVMWLMLFFKNMSGDNKSALKEIAEAIKKLAN